MKRWSLALIVTCVLALSGRSAMAESCSGVTLGVGLLRFQGQEAVFGQGGSPNPFYVSAGLRVKLGRHLAFDPEFGWYRYTFFYGYSVDEEEVTTHTDTFNLGGSALLLLPIREFELFAGGGLGQQYFRTGGNGFATALSKLGFHLTGGLDLRATDTTSLYAAIRYEFVNWTEQDSQPNDRLKQWKLVVGVRFTAD
jgi:hypothetical protein